MSASVMDNAQLGSRSEAQNELAAAEALVESSSPQRAKSVPGEATQGSLGSAAVAEQSAIKLTPQLALALQSYIRHLRAAIGEDAPQPPEELSVLFVPATAAASTPATERAERRGHVLALSSMLNKVGSGSVLLPVAPPAAAAKKAAQQKLLQQQWSARTTPSSTPVNPEPIIQPVVSTASHLNADLGEGITQFSWALKQLSEGGSLRAESGAGAAGAPGPPLRSDGSLRSSHRWGIKESASVSRDGTDGLQTVPEAGTRPKEEPSEHPEEGKTLDKDQVAAEPGQADPVSNSIPTSPSDPDLAVIQEHGSTPPESPTSIDGSEDSGFGGHDDDDGLQTSTVHMGGEDEEIAPEASSSGAVKGEAGPNGTSNGGVHGEEDSFVEGPFARVTSDEVPGEEAPEEMTSARLRYVQKLAEEFQEGEKLLGSELAQTELLPHTPDLEALVELEMLMRRFEVWRKTFKVKITTARNLFMRLAKESEGGRKGKVDAPARTSGTGSAVEEANPMKKKSSIMSKLSFFKS